MSYNHPILVPGAVGHDDPEALRSVIETLSVNAEEEIESFQDGFYSDLCDIGRTLNGVSSKLEAIVKWMKELPEEESQEDILDMASDAFYEVSKAISDISILG